jgi:hypothetical protein
VCLVIPSDINHFSILFLGRAYPYQNSSIGWHTAPVLDDDDVTYDESVGSHILLMTITDHRTRSRKKIGETFHDLNQEGLILAVTQANCERADRSCFALLQKRADTHDKDHDDQNDCDNEIVVFSVKSLD